LSRRRNTRFKCDWSSDVCYSDLKFKSNLIPKYDFKKTDYEKQQCKKLKKLYKEYINTETSHKLKSEMIQIIAHSTPNWNVSLTILS